MDDTKKAQELLTEMSGKAVETMTVWADANQRLFRELVDLGAATAKEGVRLHAELQQSAIEAVRDVQAAAVRWPAIRPDHAQDPMAAYQQVLADHVDGAQKAFRFLEASAQAVTRSAEQMQRSAERASKEIQQTLATAMTHACDVYTRG